MINIYANNYAVRTLFREFQYIFTVIYVEASGQFANPAHFGLIYNRWHILFSVVDMGIVTNNASTIKVIF